MGRPADAEPEEDDGKPEQEEATADTPSDGGAPAPQALKVGRRSRDAKRTDTNGTTRARPRRFVLATEGGTAGRLADGAAIEITYDTSEPAPASWLEATAGDRREVEEGLG